MSSEHYRAMHEGYLRELRLKYSILVKSAPALSGAELDRISRLPIDRDIRREAFKLLSEIRLHEIYFSSFSDSPVIFRVRAGERTPSSAGLLYSLKCASLSLDSGFVTLRKERGRIEIVADRDFTAHFKGGAPELAIDICEHAYFGDFGFSKSRYLEDILPKLRIDKIYAE